MFKIIKFYIDTIIKYNQSGFILFSINSAVASIISLLGIFSIFPLIALISNPNLLINNDFFRDNYILEFTSTSQLLIQISIFFLIFNFLGLLIIFINNIFKNYKKTTIIVVSHRPNKKFFTKNINLK